MVIKYPGTKMNNAEDDLMMLEWETIKKLKYLR